MLIQLKGLSLPFHLQLPISCQDILDNAVIQPQYLALCMIPQLEKFLLPDNQRWKWLKESVHSTEALPTPLGFVIKAQNLDVHCSSLCKHSGSPLQLITIPFRDSCYLVTFIVLIPREASGQGNSSHLCSSCLCLVLQFWFVQIDFF